MLWLVEPRFSNGVMLVRVRSAKPAAPSDDKRWRVVETRMRRLGNRPDALIEALHSAQEAFGFLDDAALRFIGESLLVPPSKVFGVATFYHYFTLKPHGEHTCVVCTGTACYINGAGEILKSIQAGLGVKARESCGVQSLEIGDRLSPVVEAALPKLVDTVAEVVAAHATAG